MIRTSLLVLCVFAMAGLAVAQEKVNATGKFKSFKDGTLTIAVTPIKAGDVAKDASFKVADGLKCNHWVAGEVKKEVSAVEALKATKADTTIKVTAVDGKVTSLVVGSSKDK